MHAVSFDDTTGEYGTQNVFNQFDYATFTPEQDQEGKEEWVDCDETKIDSDYESDHSLNMEEIKDYHLKYKK